MPVELWSSPPFVDAALAWVAGSVAPLGLRPTGEWEQPHCRPWSSAIRVETDGGRLWFKVNGPGTAHEARLTGLLGELAPDLVPSVLAVDEERCWSLTRDAGPVMRSLAEPDELWDRWAVVLRRYAEAQLDLAAHADAVRAAGVRDCGPEQLPGLAEKLVAELAARPVDEGGLTAEEAERLTDRLPVLADWCAELSASGLPLTVQHDDLHSSNICWGDTGPRVIDWGDSVLGHPFGTMLGTLNSIAWHAKAEQDDPRVLGARDAYLSVFGDPAALAPLVTLARRAGCVHKALSYVAAFEGEPVSAEAAEDFPVRGWLLELLED